MNEDFFGQPMRQNQRQQNQMQRQQQQLASGAVQSQGFSSLLDHYVPAAGGFDEILTDDRSVRAHWQSLRKKFGEMGSDGMDRRRKQIRRMVHQNGIAFSSYGDPEARKKHLQLDAIPQLIPVAEWEKIDVALKQRARLLNLLLSDLHGPQKLISDGILPADVLFKHPHLQLPHFGLPPAGDQHLHLYSAEIIRSESGGWWVMSDRTDSPGGSGFALENRMVISRAFPNQFRQCNVKRLAPYFLALRNHLISLSPRKIENPHIAILSAGAGSKSYFEDSFLARYLGFTLVEANDLVVRSGRVMLKTLAGLTPVDVIMRRQQGNQLDPLELGGHSPGIAGILQVIRDGKVGVVSAPGSGIVESPIFMAFMPRISKALLDADLLMPGVATWWGGEKQSRELILDRIDDVHLLPAFRQRTIAGVKPHPSMLVDPAPCSREQRIELIQNSPMDWVAQEKVNRPSTAVWGNGKLESGFISMRTFLAAEGQHWNSLPGGLVRVSKTADELVNDPFEGGGTKDAWVLGEKPAEHVSLVTSSNSSLKTSRAGGFLSSRMADNLCWLGRYLERAEATARLLRAVIVRLTNEIDPSESVELPVLIRALAVEGRIEVSFAIKEFANQLPGLDHYLTRNMLDRSDPDSLRSLVDKIASLASSVRERLSTDTWRIVQGISSNFESSDPESGDLAELLDATDELVVDLASFSGIISESMTRTNAFRFLNIGRRLESALQLVALLRNCFADPKQAGGDLLEAVLEVADSSMTYRSRYYANLNLAAVIDLLVVDESNPRSLGFQLVALNADLDALPGNTKQSAYSAECKVAIDTLHLIRMEEISLLCQSYSSGNKKPMMEFFGNLESRIPQIWVAISNRFLVHSGPVTQMITDDFGRVR